MTVSILKEGSRVKSIYFEDGVCVREDCDKVEQMDISMEAGQMGRVPWVRVIYTDGSVSLNNAAHLATITLQ